MPQFSIPFFLIIFFIVAKWIQGLCLMCSDFLLMQVTYFRIMEIRKREKWRSESWHQSTATLGYVNGIFYSYMCKYSFVTSDCVMWKLNAVGIPSVHHSNCYRTQNFTRFTFQDEIHKKSRLTFFLILKI